jgi:hypothetical protein
MRKKHLTERARDAAALFRVIDGIWESLDKVPSFTGKARFMDKVLNARTRAHNLRYGLELDVTRE